MSRPVLRGLARRRAVLGLPAGLLLPGWLASLAACAGPMRRPLVLGTSTPGGGFSLYGDTLARILNRDAGREVLHAQLTRGTAENIALLEQGQLDAALIQGTSASEIFERGTASRLRILWATYPSPGMLAVPGDSAARSLVDLRGQRVVFGVGASGLVTLARQVFDGIGLDIDRDFQAIYVTNAAESPALVIARQAAALWGAGEGWPGFVALAQSPRRARFIGPSADQISAIVGRYPRLTAMTVPALAYAGIAAPLATVGSVNFIMCRDDLDGERALSFIQALRAASPDIAAALPQAAFGTLASTVASAPSAATLHPAVLAAT